ncbi:MAG: DUF2066 domain-containing protein [Halioglobus sp.]
MLTQMCAYALIFSVASPVYAAVVKNLYEAEVAISGHGKKALEEASLVALSEVLVKVSGSVEVLQNPAIAAELDRARGHVQQYSYSRDQDASGDLTARFEFDGSVISRLLTESGAPLWSANRPPVVVWIAVEGHGGRQLASPEINSDMMTSLQLGFARRGIPARFPLLDLQDTAALSVDEVWGLQSAPIFQASGRYGVQDIVAARVTVLSTGEWVGDWTYLSNNGRVDRSVGADSLEMFMNAGVSLVAEQMARRYAVVAAGSEVDSILISVSGVNSYVQYIDLVAWLESLELIKHANVEKIQAGQLELRLISRAQANQLRTTIELNKHLLPVSPAAANHQLSYQWLN